METNVVEFLKEIYNSFAYLAEKKQIHYQFSSNLEQILLMVDQAILDKIVYNLLSNAFKFTPQLGKINFDINIDAQAQTLEIVISDTGTGIPQEKQALIFTRFAQIQPTTTGIGLSLARELADLHKGKIEFKSTPGAGSVFKATIQSNPGLYNSEDFVLTSDATEHQRLPVIDQEDEVIPARDVKALNDTKLLIIEDNSEIRDYLVGYFSKYFEVDEAKDGAEGLAKARENEPDLIICDIMMPEMDGLQVTSKLKGDFNTSHIPIILLTALASSDSELKGTEAGADAYITKPFSIKYLLTKIIKLIEQREKLRQHYASSTAQENALLCKDDRDKQFMEKAFKIVEENITNPDFSVDEFARLAGFGRTVFFKKIKGITGYSPNEYMRVVRMKKALELLQTGQFTVSEISYKVGITDPFYFSRCFKAQFGHSPSAYLKK